MLPDAPFLALVAFAGALIFGITGFGSALITIPLATHVVPLPTALALFVVVDLACALTIGLENPKNAVRAEWTRLVPTILAGTALGVTLLVHLPRQAGTALLGAFVVSYALYSLARHAPANVIRPAWGWLAGLAGGITSTLFGAGGPPYAIYLSHRGLTKEQFRATMGFATMTSISLRLVAFFVTGLLLDSRIWLSELLMVPAALTGIYISKKIFLRVSRETLLRVVALLLLASGGSLLFRAIG